MEIRSVYDYKNVYDAIRNKFDPYQVLGVSKDISSEELIRMWEKYKTRSISPQVEKAFKMLIIDSNRFVYDNMIKLVNEQGIDGLYDYQAIVDKELNKHIAKKIDGITFDTKQEFNHDLDFCKNRKELDNPSTGSKLIEHVARFVRNNEGYWFYSKDNKGAHENIIDIYQRGDKYLYYINEQRTDYLIESRYLFLDFNKPTKFNGVICRLSDASIRIKGNLLGYFTEINNMDSDIFMKYHYFRNTIGNIYEDERDGLILKVIDIRNGRVSTLGNLIHDRFKPIETICSSLMDYRDYYIDGNKVSEEDEEMLLSDAKMINAGDAKELKKIIGRRII